MPLQPRQVNRDARIQLHAHDVARPPVVDLRHLLGRVEDSLGEQEPDGQLAVMAGGAHRHRDPAADAPAVLVAGQADLQRLLDRQLVGLHGRARILHAPDLDRRDGRVDRDVRPIGAMHCSMIPGGTAGGFLNYCTRQVGSPGGEFRTRRLHE